MTAAVCFHEFLSIRRRPEAGAPPSITERLFIAPSSPFLPFSFFLLAANAARIPLGEHRPT
jgi:hypothetical protein